MALRTVTEYFGVGRDEIDQGEEYVTVKVGGDNFLEKTQTVHITYNFNPEQPVTFTLKSYLSMHVKFTTYYSNGNEYNTYTANNSSKTITAFVGGDVIITTGDNLVRPWYYYDRNGNYYELGRGRRGFFVVPSSATGSGSLYVQSGSASVTVRINESTGWCKNISSISLLAS